MLEFVRSKYNTFQVDLTMLKLYKLVIFNASDNSVKNELMYSKSASHAREVFEHAMRSSEKLLTVYPKENENQF